MKNEINISIAIAFLVALAVTALLYAANEEERALNICQKSHSYNTCFNILKR